MSTRERINEEREPAAEAQPPRNDVRDHIARLFGDARRLLDAAGPVTSRALSSDSEGFLGRQRQMGGQ